jgi:hypothetical protein
MTKHQVIERFCALATRVNEKKFQFTKSADCFCQQGEQASHANFQFEKDVIHFIERAVEKELNG